MIDNLAYSYGGDLENGVPIKPYIKGNEDFELEYLAGILELLNENEKTSEFLERQFGFKKLYARY